MYVTKAKARPWAQQGHALRPEERVKAKVPRGSEQHFCSERAPGDENIYASFLIPRKLSPHSTVNKFC